MANSKQVRKRARQSEQQRQLNMGARSAMRTTVKNAHQSIQPGVSNEESLSLLQSVYKKVDKTAAKGLIHKNKAARIKSKINKKLKQLQDK